VLFKTKLLIDNAEWQGVMLLSISKLELPLLPCPWKDWFLDEVYEIWIFERILWIVFFPFLFNMKVYNSW